MSRPPGIAPLDTVLPEDMRLARTKTSLGLMQALVFKEETKKDEESRKKETARPERDIRRLRDRAGEARDALFIRGDEAVGVHRKDAVDVASGSETFVSSTTLHSNGSETQTNASSFDRLETRVCDARDRGTVSASASRKKEKRVSPARRVFGLTCGRQRAAKEVARVASELVERRDETLRACLLVSDEINESSPERADRILERFNERTCVPGEVLLRAGNAEDGVYNHKNAQLCVIERGCMEIRVVDEDSSRAAKDDCFESVENTRLVATLTRGHSFSCDRAVLASLWGAGRNTLVAVARDVQNEDQESDPDDSGGVVLWELRDAAAYASLASSLRRRRAEFSKLWSGVPFFAKLDAAELNFLTDAARRETRHPGERFCDEFEQCDALRVVEKGRVFAHKQRAQIAAEEGTEGDILISSDAEGNTNADTAEKHSHTKKKPAQTIVREIEVGDYFGELALTSPKTRKAQKSAFTTTARDVTSALVLTTRAFRDVLPVDTIESIDVSPAQMEHVWVAGDAAAGERACHAKSARLGFTRSALPGVQGGNAWY